MLVVEGGECKVKRWYNYTPVPFENPKEDEQARHELLELYRAAVKRHLLSDVPVGILLSGGLDSGLLLALMKETGGPWPSYTVGYGNSFADDELNDAAETAALMGSRHVPVRLDQTEFERSLPHIVECLEEPVATSSIVPMYFVCQRARQDVKVALIGQGPDELFGGYKRHIGVHYGNYWRGVPKGIRSLVGSAVGCLPRNETLKRGVYSLGIENRLERYQQVFSLVPGETMAGLFRDDLVSNSAETELLNCWKDLVPQMEHTDELGGLQLLEIRSSLPDELLMYADKLSMAHGLEARVPYLDKTVVEFAQRLGAGFKIRNRNGKWLHRRVCQSYLPSAILNRKKRGFAVNVVDDWFQSSVEGHLLEMLRDEESLMFGILNPKPVSKLLNEHRSGNQDNHKLLFSLVMLEQWLRGMRGEPIGAPCATLN
jgi:asparagine synthase (glutamine-hydrolysing)